MNRLFSWHAGGLAVVAVLCLVAALGLMTWHQFVALGQARSWVQHSHAVQGTLKDLDIALRDAESGERGFLLTGEDQYLRPYQKAVNQITVSEADLARLTADNPVQQDRLRALAPLTQRKLEELAQTIEVRRTVGTEAALRVVRTGFGRQLMAQIDAALTTLMASEHELLESRLAAADRSEAWTQRLALGGATLALLLLLLAARLLSVSRMRLAAAELEQRGLASDLRTTLDSISQGIGVFDAGQRLVRWNDALPVLLGLPTAFVRAGTPYAAMAEHLTEATKGGVPFLESADEVRHGRPGRAPNEPVVYTRTRDGDGRSFELRRTSMLDGGFVLSVADITELARAEAAMREAQRMHALGQLTGGIAHDFNNLLAVVMGNLELAIKHLGSNHPVLPRLERAMWGARRGASLTQQLLAFARKQTLAPRPIDLSAALPEMARLLQRTLGEQIEVRVVDAAGLWVAMADAALFESAVLNLALNARDAMPDGGRLTIEVANKVLDDAYARAQTEVTPGDYVMIAVSDTGTGMTAEVLARVFEPFFTTKEVGKGTGLGLSMVFGFAKQSGGHLKIYSEPGEGTTVRLYLPRAVGHALAPPHRAALPIALPRGDATVLVVEDAPAVREVTAVILRDLGYRVLEAADGAEALRVFGQNDAAVDLALIDVVLPGGMKGNELASRLAEVRPELRVLFMSGYTENAIVHHGRLEDGVNLIAKPFEREQLACKVAEVLGSSRAMSG